MRSELFNLNRLPSAAVDVGNRFAGPMKNLLVISYFFPPHGGGGVLRPLETVRLLEPLGWRSLVVSGPPDGYWFNDPDLPGRVPESAEVRRTCALSGPRLIKAAGITPARGPSGRSERAVRRLRRLTDWLPLPDVYCGWTPFAVHAAMELARRADCIFSTSPPDTAHLVACYVARRTGLPWVADFRDPWLRGIYRRYPTAVQRGLQARMEARVVAGADLVLANTEEARADFVGRYPDQTSGKFKCLPNGYDPAEFASLERAPREPGVLRLIHAGGLTLERDPGLLVKALAVLNAARGPEMQRVVLELAGPVDPRFLDEARKAGIGENLRVCGRLSRTGALSRLAAADGAVLIETFRPGAELVVPMKLYDYLGAGLSVFALVPEGAASRLIARAGCGIAVTDRSDEAVAAGLVRFVERLELTSEAPFPVNREVADSFHRPTLVRKLAGYLERMT